MKELMPNEWEEYANSHGVGDVVPGTVTNITDFGVFVELAPGVEGLCHISEIDRDNDLALGESFLATQKVWCRILRIDWNESRIGLSMHSVTRDDGDDESAAAAPGVESDAPVDTAMAAALRAVGVVAEEDEDASGDESVDTAPSEEEAVAVEASVEETENSEDVVASAEEAAEVEEAAVEEAAVEEAAVEEAAVETVAEEVQEDDAAATLVEEALTEGDEAETETSDEEEKS